MAKRANGEGTIGKYKTGWRGVISYYDSCGIKKRKSLYGKTQKEVTQKMKDFKNKLNNNILEQNENITLENWFYTWLFEFRVNDLKTSSIERYEGIYRNYIKNSSLGKMKLIDLRTIHIQNYYNNLMKVHNKPASTIKSINKYLKSCLNSACKHGYILKNYSCDIIIPKDHSTTATSLAYFSVDEQKLFMKSIKTHRLSALFTMALGTGLRQGELLALNWSDIDFDARTVTVSKSIRSVKKDGKYTFEIQIPKTQNSIRTVAMPVAVIQALKNHRKNQNLEKEKTFGTYLNNNLIFATPIGTPIDSRNLIRVYKNLLKKSNIEYRKFHSLRHTYATRLFEAGVHPKTVQKLMGHADITTTLNIYTHVDEDVKFKAADTLNNVLEI